MLASSSMMTTGPARSVDMRLLSPGL
jgi:hypothetical protein